VLLRRQAIEVSGGLFDPRFFLYYEDTDLFMRMRRNDFELYIEPRASVVHNYNQCAPCDSGEKRRYMEESYQEYMRKYDLNGRIRKCAAFLGKWLPRTVSANFENLGRVSEPVTFIVPKGFENGWIFELSPNRNLMPAATQFGKGPAVRFAPDAWRLLLPGCYYARLGGVNSFFTYKTWQWAVE
jgi:hypothetical protein